MNTSTSLLIDIVHRQLTFLGHIVRKGELENLVVTGFVDSKRDRGRQRETFLNYLSKIVGKSPLELINLAKKRDVWTKFCAHSNLRIIYNFNESEFKEIKVGVSQRSILRPLIFSIYINDLSSISNTFKSIMYTDDTPYFIFQY